MKQCLLFLNVSTSSSTPAVSSDVAELKSTEFLKVAIPLLLRTYGRFSLSFSLPGRKLIFYGRDQMKFFNNNDSIPQVQLGHVSLMVKEESSMAIRFLKSGYEVNKSKVDVIANITTHPPTVKGPGNVAGKSRRRHLSRLENPIKVSREKEITERFPLETLGWLPSGDDNGTMFADFAKLP
ncbi:hypothetical protein Tco_0643439 [Tanacetum coccineum]